MSYGSGLMDVVQSSTTGTPTQFNDGSGTQIGTLCRAWVNFSSGGTIVTSFNVGSITKNATGRYSVNLINALSDANYSAFITPYSSSSTTTIASQDAGYTKTSSVLPIFTTITAGATFADMNNTYVAIFR